MGATVDFSLSSPAPMAGKSLVERRPVADDARFDITAMVDLVFMMNIFFLVSWIGAALAEIDLPAARRCLAADPDTSLVITVMAPEAGRGPQVYLGDGQSGPAMTDPDEIDRRVRAAAEAATGPGKDKKDTVLIKAEKRVRLGDVVRIASSAVSAEGTKLRLAVVEKE